MKIITTIFFISVSWATGLWAQQNPAPSKMISQPIVLGHVDEIPSKILGEKRKLSIYLPEGYNRKDTIRYPVIYLLDGGVEEDFIHIAGIVRYNTQPWINRFPKSIIVGIENTDRKRDYSFAVNNYDFLEKMDMKKEQLLTAGGSAKFIAFIEKELQPYINKKYRAAPQKTIIGESFGGLLATEILLKHRDLFDTYIIMSPSLWWGNEILLKEAPELLKSGNKQNVKVYVGACDKAENKIMYDDAVALNEVLKKYGGSQLKVYYDYLPDEIHSTIIHQAVYNAFRLLYPQTEYKK